MLCLQYPLSARGAEKGGRAMKIRRRQGTNDQPALEMTPMIDVVFQMLIFFIVVLKQDDLLSMLSASRPGTPERPPLEEQKPVELINIEINSHGFLLRGRPVSRDGLATNIRSLSQFSRTASVIIRCTADSSHKFLVQALDICNQYEMTNLSIFSM